MTLRAAGRTRVAVLASAPRPASSVTPGKLLTSLPRLISCRSVDRRQVDLNFFPVHTPTEARRSLLFLFTIGEQRRDAR